MNGCAVVGKKTVKDKLRPKELRFLRRGGNLTKRFEDHKISNLETCIFR